MSFNDSVREQKVLLILQEFYSRPVLIFSLIENENVQRVVLLCLELRLEVDLWLLRSLEALLLTS